jgi:hypothetical protein
MKRKRARLQQLADLAREVIRELDDEPLLNNKDLTKAQRQALDGALRYLDASRNYADGYCLRQAFGVELDDERGKGECRRS